MLPYRRYSRRTAANEKRIGFLLRMEARKTAVGQFRSRCDIRMVLLKVWPRFSQAFITALRVDKCVDSVPPLSRRTVIKADNRSCLHSGPACMSCRSSVRALSQQNRRSERRDPRQTDLKRQLVRRSFQSLRRRGEVGERLGTPRTVKTNGQWLAGGLDDDSGRSNKKARC